MPRVGSVVRTLTCALAAALVTGACAVPGLGIGAGGPAAGAKATPLPLGPASPGGTPSATAVPSLPPGQQAVAVPILMYHYVRSVSRSDSLGWSLSVTPQDFAAQMDWLGQHGYHPVLMRQVVAYLQRNGSLPEHAVALTFDDGYLDFWTTALPILSAHGFVATSYVIAGFIGQPGYMNGDQVTALSQLGIEIGSHTWDHVDLTTVPGDRLHSELANSRKRLEQLTQGEPVVDFCYPAGRFNQDVIAAVRGAGYLSATTTMPGGRLTLNDALTWPRVRVSGGETLSQFERSVTAAAV